MDNQKRYLSVPVIKLKVAFFEMTSCEGCQLQIINNEATLLDFISLIEIVNFREAMTEKSDEYDIAFVEGSITRSDEVGRLQVIRNNAKILVALGSCACFGGVNQLKNHFDPEWVKKEVYGTAPIETEIAQPLEQFVNIDHRIYGCPIRKEEVERVVTDLVIGKKISMPRYPVCMECKANENICLFDFGEPCLGPITRAGCNSWCPNNKAGCWGCRGPAEVVNMQEMSNIMKKHGFSDEMFLDRLECFGGFRKYIEIYKKDCRI